MKKKTGFPRQVTVPGFHGLAVPVYRHFDVKEGERYARFTIRYPLLGKPKRETFKSFELAEAAAKLAIVRISNNEQEVLELGREDAFAWKRAHKHLEGLPVSVDQACQEYAAGIKALAGHGTILNACQEHAKRMGVVSASPMTFEAVKQLLELEEAQVDGRRKKAWVKLLRSHLQNAFADNFGMDRVAELDSITINSWLVHRSCSERTKKNARDCLAYFFRWCRGQGHLAKDVDLMTYVQDFRKRRRGRVSIMEPEDLKKLLAAAGEMLPYFALRAFAGLRDSEARQMDWRHIRDGWVEVSAEVAKQVDKEDTRRLIPIRPALEAWLAPIKGGEYGSPKSGRICPVDNTARKISEVCQLAGVKWTRNVLRHSCISYDLADSGDIGRVAERSGNSPAVIRSNYLRVVAPEAAAAWWDIRP